MQTKKSIWLTTDVVSGIIRDAGYPSTSLPVNVVIEAPYAAGQHPAEIYEREDDPKDGFHYILRVRFTAQTPLFVVGQAAQLAREFTIDVNLRERYCEVIFTVLPPPRR